MRSVLRLRKSDPDFRPYDAFARILFFACPLHYLVGEHGALILWGFAVIEIGFGIAQAFGYRALRSANSRAHA